MDFVVGIGEHIGLLALVRDGHTGSDDVGLSGFERREDARVHDVAELALHADLFGDCGNDVTVIADVLVSSRNSMGGHVGLAAAMSVFSAANANRKCQYGEGWSTVRSMVSPLKIRSRREHGARQQKEKRSREMSAKGGTPYPCGVGAATEIRYLRDFVDGCDSRGYYAGEGCAAGVGDFAAWEMLFLRTGSAEVAWMPLGFCRRDGSVPPQWKRPRRFPKVPDAALPFSPNRKRLIMKRIAALIMGFVLMTVLVAPPLPRNLSSPRHQLHALRFKGPDGLPVLISSSETIAKKLGLYKFQPMDFNGIIPGLQTGNVDVGIAGMTITERQGRAVLQRLLYVRPQDLVRDDEKGISKVEDLAGKVVAVKTGTSSVPFMKDFGKAKN